MLIQTRARLSLASLLLLSRPITLAPAFQTRRVPAGTLIEPKILHWEDRATEWSGKADRVKVSLPLYRSGSLIGSALVTANSSFFTFGGDHPEDLLDAPFEA